VNERFACADCFSVLPLDSHGRCGRCGSEAVLPEALLDFHTKVIKIPVDNALCQSVE
jgi:rRNA maturation endonuclease Nob1